MGVNSLPKTVTRQRRGCDLNPGPSAPESSKLTTWPPSHYYSSAAYSVATGGIMLLTCPSICACVCACVPEWSHSQACRLILIM